MQCAFTRAIVLAVIILIGSLSWAAEPDQVQFGFAESLFSEGDYFRSISEYKRYLYLFPRGADAEKSEFRIGESYYRAGRWEEAVQSLNSYLERHPAGVFVKDAIYLRGMAQKSLKQPSEAMMSFGTLLRIDDGVYHDRAAYQIALIYVEAENWTKAKTALSLISPHSPFYRGASEYSVGLDNIEQLPRKSPAVAGTLASVLPGAGHIYTERPRDAFLAFLLNGSFIFAAVQLFRHGEYATGGIVTFFELGWYSGNVYSAVSSAHKYNRRVKSEFLQKLQERVSISMIKHPSGASRGVALGYRF